MAFPDYTPEQEKALNDLDDIFVKIGKLKEKDFSKVRSEDEWWSLGIKHFKRDLVGLCGRKKETYAREIQNRLWNLANKTYPITEVDTLVENLPDKFEIPPTKYTGDMHFTRLSHSQDQKEIPGDRLYRVTVGYTG